MALTEIHAFNKIHGMEKKKAHYSLTAIKVLVARDGLQVFTATARSGFMGMGLSATEALAAVASSVQVDDDACRSSALAGRVSRALPQWKDRLHQAHDAGWGGSDSVQGEMK